MTTWKTNTILVGVFLASTLCGQNLISNPSFEIYDSCPYQGGQIHFATGWFQPVQNYSSTDYFHICSSIPQLGIPNNLFGGQPSYEGGAYGGFSPYTLSQNAREYIENHLSETLVAGNKYKLRFYVSAAGNSMYAVDKIGAYFTSDSVLTPSAAAILVSPGIDNVNGVLSDSVNWMLFEGIYQATGGENYLTIGNFYDNDSAQVSVINPAGYSWAYYYIDSVSLTLYDDTGIPPSPTDPQIQVNNLLHPNDFFTATNLPPQSVLNVYDSRGRIIYRYENYQNDLSANQLSSGMYLYEFILPDQSRKTGKLVVE